MCPYPYYSASEALQIAMNMEIEGRDFYMAALKTTHDPRTRNVLKRLVADEISHMHRIAETLAPLVKEEDEKIEPFETAGEFIELYERRKIFVSSTLPAFMQQNPSDQRMLEHAVLLEEKAVAYYEERERTTDDLKAKRLFGELINEEKSHVLELKNRLENLKKE